ncbi:hypothetical protein XELAEV_18006872mg [Xenopus laevis]|uniref:Uncharacterized protein n=1 Tax=Xenopus laevis TaxID=8355 RepID=A0A974I4L5_XENLA|nr:hypothetical protein XELAEV_18006872mg [Xenopus laevis]
MYLYSANIFRIAVIHTVGHFFFSSGTPLPLLLLLHRKYTVVALLDSFYSASLLMLGLKSVWCRGVSLLLHKAAIFDMLVTFGFIPNLARLNNCPIYSSSIKLSWIVIQKKDCSTAILESQMHLSSMLECMIH